MCYHFTPIQIETINLKNTDNMIKELSVGTGGEHVSYYCNHCSGILLVVTTKAKHTQFYS